MENQSAVEKDINSIGTPEKQKSRLPIIALAFSLSFLFAPVWGTIFWLSGYYIHPLVGMTFLMLAAFGFPIMGVILGITALCSRKKHIGVNGLILSIIAILLPPLWFFIMW